MGDEIDWGLHHLLELNGYVAEAGGGYWYKIEAKIVEATPERPHGIKYSLTLHAFDGPRLYGIDNAHAVKPEGNGPGRRKRIEYDHEHQISKKVVFYEYAGAEDLLKDFFEGVDRILGAKGVKR